MGGVLSDPGEQRHLELIDEALSLLVAGQSDHADNRDACPLSRCWGQQKPRIGRLSRSAKKRIGNPDGAQAVSQLSRGYGGPVQSANAGRQGDQKVDERIEIATSLTRVVTERLGQYAFS
jgi:hypothetical protein